MKIYENGGIFHVYVSLTEYISLAKKSSFPIWPPMTTRAIAEAWRKWDKMEEDDLDTAYPPEN